ncbi:MAG: Oligopeptide ABC transporter, periplasmic oligopeptide-binding protein OppA [Candidatus Ozemobacter sibiricus]|uniref:Oligopeptide ABC transporter, periplasmic oligopeptide-binding protein OppA n=1 Tax=Candidatus Ozemobacter sibiricus TaxID=2268124 RepID=A0A367ZQQ2_9BACT|nr:MAG: Oligopeptide ABC transporter, periplasmic oligopeptide-binding protein OppA [Candidatus Ozemobacter sibiricus]
MRPDRCPTFLWSALAFGLSLFFLWPARAQASDDTAALEANTRALQELTRAIHALIERLDRLPGGAMVGSSPSAVLASAPPSSSLSEASAAADTGSVPSVASTVDPMPASPTPSVSEEAGGLATAATAVAAPSSLASLLETVQWQTNEGYKGLGSREAKKGGTLRYVSTAFPPTLRPFGRNSNSATTRTLEGLVYETLLDLDPITFEYVPNLARRWAIGPDQKTFLFEIDPSARWSDGRPVTASDVLTTYRFFTDPDLDDPFTNDYWKKYEPPVALGERIVVFRSKELNWRAFMSAAVGFTIYPAHVLDRLTARQFLEEYQFKMLPGSGPYKFESCKVNQEVVLERRPDWWQVEREKNTGYYNFDRLQFLFIEDENLIKEKFKKGELDWLLVNVAREWHQVFIPALMPQIAKGWVQRRKVYTHQPVGVSGIAFNLRRPPFDDKRVRLAFAHLFNREKMMDKLFFNEYEYLDTFFPNSPYENPDNPKIRFDPDRAVELLEAAGWKQADRDAEGWLTKNGQRFEVSLNFTSASTERYLTIFQEDLKDVGIKLNLKQVTWATDIKEVGERNFLLSNRAYGGLLFPNPESTFHSKFADKPNNNNIWGFKNARVDAICASYPAMFDPQDRIKAVREIDGIVCREHLYAFGWYAAHTRLLYWNRFGMPPGVLAKNGDERSIVALWWVDPEKERALETARAAGTALPIEPEVVRWWDERYPRQDLPTPTPKTTAP